MLNREGMETEPGQFSDLRSASSGAIEIILIVNTAWRLLPELYHLSSKLE